jgi:hypothetical protein
VRFTLYFHDEFDTKALERHLKLSDLEIKSGKIGKWMQNVFKSYSAQILPLLLVQLLAM